MFGESGELPENIEVSFQAPEAIVEKDMVLEKFKDGKLLTRVMDQPIPAVGENGLELGMDSWRDEMKFMSSEAGMPHVSTTLIMEGKAIPMYIKAFGFLFDADKVKAVEHVASGDSGSSVTSEGGLRANKTDLHSLQELRDYYHDKTGGDMNEVNVTVDKSAIVGLVMRKGISSPITLANLEVVRRFLREQGEDLPVYVYDETKGKMEKYVDPDKEKLIESMRPANQSLYRAAI